MLFCLLRRTFVLCYCHANAYLVLTIGPLRHFCLASRGIARICTWGAGGGGLAMVQSDNNIVTYIHTYTYVSMFK
jgi:hypothetical protein